WRTSVTNVATVRWLVNDGRRPGDPVAALTRRRPPPRMGFISKRREHALGPSPVPRRHRDVDGGGRARPPCPRRLTPGLGLGPRPVRSPARPPALRELLPGVPSSPGAGGNRGAATGPGRESLRGRGPRPLHPA